MCALPGGVGTASVCVSVVRAYRLCAWGLPVSVGTACVRGYRLCVRTRVVLGHRLGSGTRVVLTDGPGRWGPLPERLGRWCRCPGQAGDGGRLAVALS